MRSDPRPAHGHAAAHRFACAVFGVRRHPYHGGLIESCITPQLRALHSDARIRARIRHLNQCQATGALLELHLARDAMPRIEGRVIFIIHVRSTSMFVPAPPRRVARTRITPNARPPATRRSATTTKKTKHNTRRHTKKKKKQQKARDS